MLERTPLFTHRALMKGNDLQTPMEFCKQLLIRQENGEIAFPPISAKDAEMDGAP
jgi:hypothetical protein